VSAQRNSAWADIARRIAHEIKNPLTPIQLSAERLKRKYTKEIQTDPQIFEQCTNTIIRQVGDIGRMVDEFSSFARMPSAILETQDLAEVVKEATILQRVSASDIEVDVQIPDHPVLLSIDRRLVTQAVTNLVKNAREAIEIRQKETPQPKGVIKVEIDEASDHVSVNVTDNGIGLPVENRHRLTEPYMTTREKGTGLGLAIVKRIMEEHGGKLVLQDAPMNGQKRRGAQARLVFTRQVATMELHHPAAGH
jgi:two-component system nitrogen regulation sensor histidine kinase NtrY